MKIGYVLNVFPKLSEMFVLNEIIELRKLGHEIIIFSVYASSEKIKHSEVDEYDLLKNTYYLPPLKKPLNAVKTAIASLGFFGWGYPASDFNEKLIGIAAAKRFSKIARREKIDVIHSHFNTISTHTAMLMSKLTGIPYTFTAHAFDIFVNNSPKVLRTRIDNSNFAVTESKFNQRYMAGLSGCSEERIKVVHIYPNIDTIKKIPKPKKHDKEINLISVARLVEKKGLTYSIDAIKKIVRKYPDVKYTIIGKGPLEAELKEKIAALSLEKNVILVSELPNIDVLRQINNSDIFVMACIKAKNGDMDGTPNSILEAMALGVPVVSTKLAGIPEVISDGKEGLLVEPKNSEQLTEAIIRLIEDKGLRSKIIKNAKIKIDNEFNAHKEIKKLIALWS
ncbi:MAG: glycosyltransferase [Nanoarchaeota archaeon]